MDLEKGKIELTQFKKNPGIKRTNKLAGIKEMVLNLNELDNSDNLEDGRLTIALLTYHMTVLKNLWASNQLHSSIRNLGMGSSIS